MSNFKDYVLYPVHVTCEKCGTYQYVETFMGPRSEIESKSEVESIEKLKDFCNWYWCEKCDHGFDDTGNHPVEEKKKDEDRKNSFLDKVIMTPKGYGPPKEGDKDKFPTARELMKMSKTDG